MNRERTQILSLTLINWNGFFARTFELDPSVTTISGGNGSGKSTVMAAFLVTLIPDLSLLHFRNNTEAGSVTASQDRGLHGKLNGGDCYSLLRVQVSSNQQALVGVRLQQLATREGKVDLKPFVVTDWPADLDPIQLCTEPLEGSELSQVKICPFKSLMNRAQTLGRVLQIPASTLEYHQRLFELGLLPKLFRKGSERAKLYKLFEASLYGGLSIAITRALREYLLPEQIGVKKAFQELESAVQENRLTITALQRTRKTRDFFKQLLESVTTYVSCECMRQQNSYRRSQSEALGYRRKVWELKAQMDRTSILKANIAQRRQAQQERLSACQASVEALSTRLAQHRLWQIQANRIRQHEDQLAEKRTALKGAHQALETRTRQFLQIQSQYTQITKEICQIQKQLADQSELWNAQQIQAVQYRQAIEAKAALLKDLGRDPTGPLDLAQEIDQNQQNLRQLQSQLITQEHALCCIEQIRQQYESSLQQLQELVNALPTPLEDTQSLDEQLARVLDFEAQAKEWMAQAPTEREICEATDGLKAYRAVEAVWIHLIPFLPPERVGMAPDSLSLALHHLQEHRQDLRTLLYQLEDHARQVSYQHKELQSEIDLQERRLKAFYLAQESKTQLEAQVGVVGLNADSIRAGMQARREKRSALAIQLSETEGHLQVLEKEINRLVLMSVGEQKGDQIQALADQLGGIRLCELLDETPLPQAQFISALLSPFEHAIVVACPLEAKKKLMELECPIPDLYLLPQATFGSTAEKFFQAEQGKDGVIAFDVTSNILRYSRFPEMPWAGDAARAAHLAHLQKVWAEMETQRVASARALEQATRHLERVEQFFSEQSGILFEENPERQIDSLRRKERELQSKRQEADQKQRDAQERLDQLNPHLRTLESWSHSFGLLESSKEPLQVRVQRQTEAQQLADQATVWLRDAEGGCDRLRPLPKNFFQQKPQDSEALKADLVGQQAQQKRLLQLQFSLEDLHQRLPHLNYSGAIAETSEGSTTLIYSLKQKLRALEMESQTLVDPLKLSRLEHDAANQSVLAAESQIKAEEGLHAVLIEQLQQLQQSLLVQSSAENLVQGLEEARAQLLTAQENCVQCEGDAAGLAANLRHAQETFARSMETYRAARQQALSLKVGWRALKQQATSEKVSPLLFLPSLALESEQQLRQQGDQSLGRLRPLLSEDEYLRNLLRASESPFHPQKKLELFVAVINHLKVRIRRDIFQSTDPIQVIDEMESELSRLEKELLRRGETLRLSCQGLARLIEKSVQREQTRIAFLNEHLTGAVFGQVSAIRLRMQLLPAHARLLEALASPEALDVLGSGPSTPDLDPESGFCEKLGKFYYQLNPEARVTGRAAQFHELGESLLDYRNYLEVIIEVQKNASTWKRAQSGALSTGEAIGTGMAILMMVIQSWEEESVRFRGRNQKPCRVLLLDEAARLDSDSIATLYELCQKLELQLLLAAPEHVGADGGSTYQLKRTIVDGKARVHVVGLRSPRSE